MKLVNRMLVVGALAVAMLGVGCASKGEYIPPATSERVASDDLAEREAQLRDLVKRRRIQEAHARDENRDDVKRDNPYFYKEYADYPDGENIEIQFQETESKASPLLASVVLPKIRYSTRLHRERQSAVMDTNFFRDTGYETQEYALRNGRWVSLGNTFVAESSEQQVNGVWEPVREEIEERTTPATESGGGWLKRTWSAITGS